MRSIALLFLLATVAGCVTTVQVGPDHFVVAPADPTLADIYRAHADAARTGEGVYKLSMHVSNGTIVRAASDLFYADDEGKRHVTRATSTDGHHFDFATRPPVTGAGAAAVFVALDGIRVSELASAFDQGFGVLIEARSYCRGEVGWRLDAEGLHHETTACPPSGWTLIVSSARNEARRIYDPRAEIVVV